MPKRHIRTLKVEFDDDTGEMLGFANLKEVCSGVSDFMVADWFNDLESRAHTIAHDRFTKFYKKAKKRKANERTTEAAKNC